MYWLSMNRVLKGFGLYDRLTEDGIKCVVTPPNKVTQEKSSRIKTDKTLYTYHRFYTYFSIDQ